MEVRHYSMVPIRVIGRGAIYMIPFDSLGEIGPGESVTLVTTPAHEVRITRLVVDDVTAPHFTIDDILVGKNSQFVIGQLPMSCEIFKPGHTGLELELKFDRPGPRADVSLVVTNVHDAAHRFIAAMVSEVV